MDLEKSDSMLDSEISTKQFCWKIIDLHYRQYILLFINACFDYKNVETITQLSLDINKHHIIHFERTRWEQISKQNWTGTTRSWKFKRCSNPKKTLLFKE